MSNSLKRRVKALEERFRRSKTNLELYDYHGNRLEDARLLKMPTREEEGEALLSDGTKRVIVPHITMRDILFSAAAQLQLRGKLAEPKSDEDREQEKQIYRDILLPGIDGV